MTRTGPITMFPTFECFDGHLFVGVAVATQVNRKPVSKRLGQLGSVPLSRPVGLAARIWFWGQFDARWSAIAAAHHISEADAKTLRRKIGKRIPEPSGAVELRQQGIAGALSDLLAAAEDGGGEAFGQAAVQLAELAREDQRQRRSETKEPA
jgi:hypothetical protein